MNDVVADNVTWRPRFGILSTTHALQNIVIVSVELDAGSSLSLLELSRRGKHCAKRVAALFCIHARAS